MNKIFEVKFGSHLYGTNTDNSDTDYKGIYLPTAKEICLNSYKKTICSVRSKQIGERNNKNDIDIEFFSLDQFLKLLCEGQTVALDMLFSPEFKMTDWIIEDELKNRCWHPIKAIWNHRDKFLNKNTNAFVGYTKQQAAKYGVKGFRVHALGLVLNKFKEVLEENEYNIIKYLYQREPILNDLDLEYLLNEWDNPHIKIVTDSKINCHQQKFLEVCDKKNAFSYAY